MNFLRKLACPFVAFLCILLVSCIEGREEIWVNADGSGRADITYDIPAAAARFHGGAAGVLQLMDNVLKDVSSSDYEVLTKGDRLIVHVKLRFDSASDLMKLTSSVKEKKTPASFEHLTGKFDVTRLFRTVDFTRTIAPGKALPTAFIPLSEFQNRKLTYIFHLPVVPVESTATRTADGGRTLIWEQSLADAMRKPVIVHFKAKIPIPSWIISIVVALIFLIGLGIFALLRKRKSHFAGTSRK